MGIRKTNLIEKLENNLDDLLKLKIKLLKAVAEDCCPEEMKISVEDVSHDLYHLEHVYKSSEIAGIYITMHFLDAPTDGDAKGAAKYIPMYRLAYLEGPESVEMYVKHIIEDLETEIRHYS